MASLSDLLTQQTAAQVFQTLLSYYQAAGFPVTSWQPGGVERTRLMAFATAISSTTATYIPAIAGGSLLDYSPNYPGWTALTAQEIYELIQNAATFTVGNIVFTNAATSSYSYSPSSPLTAVFALSGRRYFSVGSGTIAASGNTTVSMQAEFAGAAYADPSNTGSANLTLSTPLPGVTLNNPASSYTSVTHTGSGTGTVTPGGSPVGNHSLVISITSTGQAGVATWSYSLDGAAAVAAGAVSSLTNIGGFGINVTLANGAINPSFVVGDSYTFNTPGSWITSQGSDIESDVALAARCRNRWSSLSNIPTQGYYQLLAMSVPGVGSQVTQATVVVDPFINNKINIIVSGPGGVLPGPTISTIQAFITSRARLCDNPVVQSPTTLAITYGGTITVLVAQLASAQAAITTALQNYTAGIATNGTIRLADVIQVVMDVSGVVDFTGATINGSAANLTLGGVGSYVLPAYPPTLSFGYVAQ